MRFQNGSLLLFRLGGIEVFLHWSWVVVAYFRIKFNFANYESQVWAVAEYVSLFGIVLMHEFGHALACRQVGGIANRIVLWPLGGVAYVQPPPRPGALLWSIVAGPLVNAVLVPVTLLLLFGALSLGDHVPKDVNAFVWALTLMNIGLLIFNLLPFYPLDGGQILRALLWFVIGPAHSLMVSSVIGVVGSVLGLAVAIFAQSPWLGILAGFAALNSFSGLRRARALSQVLSAPRYEHLTCPACHGKPPIGAHWMCGRCRQWFDMFQQGGRCPHCGVTYPNALCPECLTATPMASWGLTQAGSWPTLPASESDAGSVRHVE